MSIIVGEVVAPIRGDTRPFQRSISETRSIGESAFTKLGEGMKNFGGIVKNVGSTISKGITLPLVGASIAVFKLGKDFESEMSKVVGLVGVAKDQVDLWSKEIIAIAPDLGKAPKELADALFFVTSAGLRGADAMDVLVSSAKASTSGLGETSTIADLVTSAMNAYGSENLTAAKATDILVAAVREGKAEAAELAASMGQVLPLSSELGVSFDQVAATQAAMTKTGTNASEAATQLKSIMAGLIKPSKQAEETLAGMGTSSAKMRKAIREDGLLSALMDLREMTNKYGDEAMSRVFPNIRALMGVLDLMGSNLEGNIKTFDAVKNSTGSLDKAFQAASETLEFKWNSAIGKVKSTLLGFFDIIKALMLPVLEKFIQILDFVSKKFESFSPAIKKVILILTGLAMIVGPVFLAVGTAITALGAIIAGVTAIVTGLITVFSTIGLPVLAAIALATTAVITAFTLLAVGIGAAIGILVGSFIRLWKTNTEFRNKAISTWNLIKSNAIEIFNEIGIIIYTVFNRIKEFWSKHGNDIMAIMSRVWNVIFVIVKNGMNAIKNIVKFISAMVQGDWRKAWESLKQITRSGNNILKTIFNSLKNVAARIFQQITLLMIKGIAKGVNGINNLLWGLPGKFLAFAINAKKAISSINFYNVGSKIVQSIINGITGKARALKTKMDSIASIIRDRFPFSPAKEGPLKDLDKINFAGPISKSLQRAKSMIEIPVNSLGNSILGNLETNDFNFAGTNGKTGNINFYGDFKFEGVNDIPDFMDKMRRTILRHGGGNVL